MRNMHEDSSLKDEINLLRQKLDKLVDSNSLNSTITLKLSEELDCLIAQYYCLEFSAK